MLLKIRQNFSSVPEQVRYQLQLIGGCVTQASKSLAGTAPAPTVKALFGANTQFEAQSDFKLSHFLLLATPIARNIKNKNISINIKLNINSWGRGEGTSTKQSNIRSLVGVARIILQFNSSFRNTSKSSS